MDAIGITSRMTAAARAYETRRTDALFRDPLAGLLAGSNGFSLWSCLQRAGAGADPYGANRSISVRTRFLDDMLISALAHPALRQVVLLGAGMDMRAFRMPWPDGVVLFELDCAEVLDEKELILRPLTLQPCCNRRMIAVDLKNDWPHALLDAGFDAARPSAFIMEGVLVYLEARVVARLFECLREIAPAGSRLGADIADEGLLSHPRMKGVFDWLADLGCPLRFGTSQPGELLARAGWTAEVFVPDAYNVNSGGRPLARRGRVRPGGPHTYLISAYRANDPSPNPEFENDSG